MLFSLKNKDAPIYFILSLNTSHVKCVENSSHVLMKLLTGVTGEGILEHNRFVPKLPIEFTEKDEKEVHKNKNALNIAFNSLHRYIFDNIIYYTSSK